MEIKIYIGKVSFAIYLVVANIKCISFILLDRKERDGVPLKFGYFGNLITLWWREAGV
jgi:hypothetical protein